MAEVIDYDGLAVSVPDACPFCGAERRWRNSSVIGTYVCGTAMNFRPNGQHHQTHTCLEGAPAFAATAARAEIVAWLRAERRRYTRDKDFSAAIALTDAAAAIESGAPQRWAAERDARG